MSLTAFLDPEYGAELDALADLQGRRARDFADESRTLVSLYSRTSGWGWQGSAPTDSLVMEIAGTCLVAQQTASGRLGEALHLVKFLPQLLAELEVGAVFVPQAKVLIDETMDLSVEVCAQVEQRVLPCARELAPGRLRTKVRATILAVDAEEAARRQAAAKVERGVRFRPDQDGQALLIARGPALALRQLDLRLTAEAKALIAAGDPRTLEQLRFDLMCEHNAGIVGVKPVQAVIHVPVATALGLSEDPGELAGYGPLPATTTRELLMSASLLKACVDEQTGRVVTADPTATEPAGGCPEQLRRSLLQLLHTPTGLDDTAEPQHDPSAALVRQLRLRDSACDGVGCSVSASRCENDHMVRWPEGPTSLTNLRPRSPRCHHAKHNGPRRPRHWRRGGSQASLSDLPHCRLPLLGRRRVARPRRCLTVRGLTRPSQGACRRTDVTPVASPPLDRAVGPRHLDRKRRRGALGVSPRASTSRVPAPAGLERTLLRGVAQPPDQQGPDDEPDDVRAVRDA